MSRAPDPFAFLRLSQEVTLMSVEAGAVIWMRGLGMVGLWHVPAQEPQRMLAEKPEAFAEAGRAALAAAWRGASPDRALAAALEPLRRATRSNSRRLSRRGPQS